MFPEYLEGIDPPITGADNPASSTIRKTFARTPPCRKDALTNLS